MAGTLKQSNKSNKFHKKDVLYLISATNSFRDYPTEFAGAAQNHKKVTGKPNRPIKSKKFPNKVCLVYLKREKYLQVWPKIIKKMTETPKLSTNQNENCPKKVCLVPQKRKRVNLLRGYPTDFVHEVEGEICNLNRTKKTVVLPSSVYQTM
jgi:hypothetical protein